MSYDGVERSVQDAIRAEVFTFELPTQTYRYADFDENLVVGGETFVVTSISRGPVPLAAVGKVRELTITIALDDPLAVTLRQYGIPHAGVLVTIDRVFIGEPETARQWVGFIKSIRTDGQYTRIQSLNRADFLFNVSLPVKLAERACSYQLFDRGCGVNQAGFVITPTVASSSGNTIVVSSMSGKPDHWASLGKITRQLDGEPRTVLEQVGTTLTLDSPYRGLANGETVALFAGCDKQINGLNGCHPKFDNAPNFGGEPEMPVGNPSAPTGYGVAVQV